MNDLISRQEAIEAVYQALREPSNSELFMRISNVIKELPPAAQVRHGRWERKKDPYGFFDTIPVCSACGCMTKYRETSLCCPNCGAKMDEEEG